MSGVVKTSSISGSGGTLNLGKDKKTLANEKGLIMEQGQDADLEFYGRGINGSDDEQTMQSFEPNFDEMHIDQLPKIKTKSEQVCTDHSKVYYRPFRKNFYVEVPELSKLTAQDIEIIREELEGIHVRGKNCPKPVLMWAQCGVSLKVLECLKKNGFERPTPIQSQAIPIIMSGRDMIGIAKTGSGKTLAFLLPLFRHVLDQPPLEPDDGPIAIIMTPTRELATQIAKEARRFTRLLDLRVVCVYGGMLLNI